MEKKTLRRIGLIGLGIALLGLSGCSSSSDSSGSETRYTVSFETYGGTEIPAIEVTEGEKITAPADPVKADHEFAGWYEDDAFVDIWNFDSDIVVGDMTLYAKW